jgi:hypothetical protein
MDLESSVGIIGLYQVDHLPAPAHKRRRTPVAPLHAP